MSKVWVKFNRESDLRRGVTISKGLGGVVFRGLAKVGFQGLSGELAVFYSEHDSLTFVSEMLDQGAKVDYMVVKNGDETRGILPMATSCVVCGEKMNYFKEFSREGSQLCDRCLAVEVEAPLQGG